MMQYHRDYVLVQFHDPGRWKAYVNTPGWGDARYRDYGTAWFEAETPEELRELIDCALAELPEPVL